MPEIDRIKSFLHLAGVDEYFDIKPLNRGQLNTSYRIANGAKSYVLRVNNNQTPGIYREHEVALLKSIQHLNISPCLVHTDKDFQFALFEFIEGAPLPFEELSESQWDHLLQTLRSVHSFTVPQFVPGLLDRLNLYEDMAVLPSTEENRYLVLKNQLFDLGFFQTETLIHSDLNPQNLLWGQSLRFIDWEFAGRGHPIFDLVVLDFYCESDLMTQTVFKNYVQQFANGEDLFDLCKDMLPYMMKLWEAAWASVSRF